MAITRDTIRKCINNKKISSVSSALLVLLFAGIVYFLCIYEWNEFYLKKYANADAKFYNDYVITSVDEGICVLDFNGKVVAAYGGLKASWIYTYPEEGLVVYSNHDNETHILFLDDELNAIVDQVILNSELLAIDPTICKVGDTYLVTYTTIDGTINNPDPDGENGTYTLELFVSEDLENWEHRTTITSQKQDIEDVDMIYDNGKLYCFYEKEDYDKGPSAICMRCSEDEGQSWSEEKELIANIADNEPACVLPTEDGWRLYYSSDYECVGQSYNGASAYYAEFDKAFRKKSEFQKISMRANHGVRLYEAKELDGKVYLLFAHNFMTDKDFVLRKGKLNKERDSK